jgi:hypothetical protein
MKKNKVSLFILMSVIALPVAAFAADATVGGAAQSASGISPFTALIPLAVPVVIALLKAFVPKIPSLALPILAPLLGAFADIALHYAGVATLGPLWGMVLGSAGVGLRELQDQLKQTVLPPADPAK